MCRTNILFINESNIHGNGLFCKINLNKGDCIGLLARVYGKDNFDDKPYGNYINHSKENNIKLDIINDVSNSVVYVIGKANKYIKAGEELTANYLDKYAPRPNFINKNKFIYN